MATAMNMNTNMMGYDMQNSYAPQCCSCTECQPPTCVYPGSSAPPSPTPSQSNWWMEDTCEETMNRVAPPVPTRGPTPPMPRENFSQQFQSIDRTAHQWGNHNQHMNQQPPRAPTPRNANTPPLHPHSTHHHHPNTNHNMHNHTHSYPYGERRASYGCNYTQPHKPASYAHLPLHHHHQASPMVPRAHTPGPAVMGGVSTHPTPVTRRNSMPLPNKYPSHIQNHAAPVVPGSGPQEASRIRFVNAKCWRHDPYSETAYRAEPKTPLTTGMTFNDVEEVVETETNDSVTISPRNGSPQPLTVASDDDVRPSFSHSSSFSDFSIGPVDEARKTFTEEELINNPDEVVATPGNTTDEDGCCWVEVLVGSDGVRKRRYRFSGVLPCGHRAFAKRLRYRRGWTYFMCVSCGFKWGESGVR